MNSKDSPSIGLKEEDERFILQKQYSKYQEIRDKTSQIFHLVLSVVSLVASIGFIQLLFSGNVAIAGLPVDTELANRCAPEALTHSGVSLHGLGPINYWLVGGLLILTLYLIVEIWYVNSLSQSLPSLRPQSELELYVYDYQDFIEHNRIYLKHAQQYLFAVKNRLYYASTLAGVAGLILIQLYYKRPLYLLIADPIILFTGLGLLLYWVYQYFRIDESGLFRWRTHDASPMFIVLFAAVWVYILVKTRKVFLIIDYFFIC